MAKRDKPTKFKAKVLSVRLLIIIGFVLLIVFSVSLAKEMYHKYQINKEIKEVQAEINSLEEKNEELKDLIEYLNTNSFKEIQARQQLGLQKEGEQAIAIQSAPEEEAMIVEQEEEPTVDKSNTERWWSYFFAKKD